MKRTIRLAATFALAITLPSALSAQDSPAESGPPALVVPDVQVSATDPDGLLALLQAAGLKDSKLIPRLDDEDKPMIEVENEGLKSFILFKDCDEAVPGFCETLVLSTSWDRETPMTGDAVAQANFDFRYISVWRDEDGDPFAQWAIFTGRAGIPATVFLEALTRYQTVVYDFWAVVFDGDEGTPTEESAE